MKKAKKSRKRKTIDIFKALRPKPLSRSQKLKLLKRQQKIDREKRRLDPFYINPDHIPKGKAYQWFSLKTPACSNAETIFDDAEENGWRAVPFSRHNFNRKRNAKGKIVIDGTILMENTARYVDECKAEDRAKISRMNDDAEIKPHRQGEPFRVLSPGFVVSSKYDNVPAGAKAIVAKIAINFRISRDWQDAAAALSLSPEEYARRRLLMEPPLLASYEAGDSIFEPVELQMKKM